MADAPPPRAEQPLPERIDSTFRNGSVTAIGVVLSFSLGFLNVWATQPSVWRPPDLAAIVAISIGLGAQFRALAGMLAVASLQRLVYERLIRIFLVGLGFVLAGVAIALIGDAVALKP